MDRIELHGIRVFGHHGAEAAEREVEQPFDIDLVLDIDLHTPQASDDLADTLNYAVLHARVAEIVVSTSHALLESLVGDLLDAVFMDPRVQRAEVTVAKPKLLDGATPSVTLARERPHRHS